MATIMADGGDADRVNIRRVPRVVPAAPIITDDNNRIEAGGNERGEKVNIRKPLTIALAATLLATDPLVSGPPIALYAMCCAVVVATDAVAARKSLYDRVRHFEVGYRDAEWTLLKQQADGKLLQGFFYFSSSLLILYDCIYRLYTGKPSNAGMVALMFSGAMDGRDLS